ncbi:MAG: hemerythrin domain-containing protein [Microbacter sp.]
MTEPCKSNDTLWELIVAHPSILLVMNRFSLSLGVGDKTVHEICQEKKIDEQTFLAILNMTVLSDHYQVDPATISLPTLISYLKNAHHYFFNFRYPAIRQKLIDAIDQTDKKFYELMLRYYDEYVDALKQHTEYEEKSIFSLAASTTGSETGMQKPILGLQRWHSQIELKMNELKNIIIKYFPSNDDASALNLAVYDLFACEEEFSIHCRIEDQLLTPAIQINEQRKANKK